jgi:hypothetical protein
MSVNFRLKEKELDELEPLSLEINKALIAKGNQPIQLSKVIHLAIEVGIEELRKDPSKGGDLYYRK